MVSLVMQESTPCKNLARIHLEGNIIFFSDISISVSKVIWILNYYYALVH